MSERSTVPSPPPEAPGRRSLPLALDALVVVAIWLVAIAGYATLPERFPIHFDLAGNADGWAERGPAGLLIWMLLPVIATLMSLLLRWAPGAARANPHFWNMPRKREFLALTPAQREPIHRLLTESMAWLALFVSGTLAALQATMLLAVHGGGVRWMFAAPFVLVILSVLLAARASRRAAAAIAEATSNHRSDR